jgi:xanthine dehydrogenase accessory factor
VTNIFKKLYESLSGGAEAVLVTLYGPKGLARYLNPRAEDLKDLGLDLKDLGLEESDFKPESLRLYQNQGALVLMEPFSPKPRLIVFGGGHLSLALAPMAALMDFELIIYDDRPSFSSPSRFPMADQVICDSFEAIEKNLLFNQKDYVVIVTRGHRHDEDCLKCVLKGQEPHYTGMIGSKRRVAIVKKLLLNQGYDPQKLERLDSPIGLAIGAVTPPEIAVAILAKITQVRREKVNRKNQETMEVFADLNLLKFLAQPRAEPLALATVVSTIGSTPRRAGAKMAIHFDGRTVGSIGGGCSEAEVIMKARSIMESQAYQIIQVDMTDSAEEDGMVCGGTMRVLIEPLGPT